MPISNPINHDSGPMENKINVENGKLDRGFDETIYFFRHLDKKYEKQY